MPHADDLLIWALSLLRIRRAVASGRKINEVTYRIRLQLRTQRIVKTLFPFPHYRNLLHLTLIAAPHYPIFRHFLEDNVDSKARSR